MMRGRRGRVSPSASPYFLPSSHRHWVLCQSKRVKCKAEERDLFSEAFKVKSFMKVEGRGCRASFFTFIWSIGRSVVKEPSSSSSSVREQRRA